jgi:predicted permease
MDRLLANLRHAARSWLNDPIVAIAALVTLVLGIGATTVVFSVVDAVLFRPLPFTDPSTLVRVVSVDPADADAGVTLEDVQALKGVRSLAAVAVYYRNTGWSRVTLTSGEPESVQATFTSASLFRILGVTPILGRTFEDDEGHAQAPVAVLSHRLWLRRFAGATDVLQRTIEIDGRPFQVIGIMPATFQFPAPDVQLWVPITKNRFWSDRLTPDATRNANFFRRWNVVARLASDAGVTRARADISRVMAVTLTPVDARLSPDTRRAMQLFFAAVFVVWLIACSNVVTLVLARDAAHVHDYAVRRALGAGAGRLVEQTLFEVGLIFSVAAMLAVAMASPIVKLLVAAGPRDLPRLEHAAVDGRVLAFTIITTVAAAGVVALVPAWSALRRHAAPALRMAGVRGPTPRGRVPSALVACQFGLAVLLLVTAGLLVRSFVAIGAVALGFRPEHVLTTRVGLPAAAPSARRATLSERVSDRIRVLPGVEAVGGIAGLFETASPPSLGFRTVEGRAPEPRDRWTALTWTTVSGDYFRAMGTRILQGRVFTDRDGPDAPLVAVIDESLAARYWPGASAIGRRFKGQDVRGAHDEWLTVIGMVADMRRQGREHAPAPHVFEWQPQSHRDTSDLVIRTSGDPASLANSVRAVVRAEEPAAVISTMATMEARLDDQLAERRFQLWTLSMFALIALLLAAAGIYGLMHQAVGRRVHELGVRMALGARPSDVLRLVVGEGLALAMGGAAAGVLASRWLTRLLTTLLYGVSPADPLTVSVSVIVLVLVAAAATAVPAWRAASVNPLVALKE